MRRRGLVLVAVVRKKMQAAVGFHNRQTRYGKKHQQEEGVIRPVGLTSKQGGAIVRTLLFPNMTCNHVR